MIHGLDLGAAGGVAGGVGGLAVLGAGGAGGPGPGAGGPRARAGDPRAAAAGAGQAPQAGRGALAQQVWWVHATGPQGFDG